MVLAAFRQPLPSYRVSVLAEKNSRFYDAFWARTYLTRPERFNTWPLISSLVPGAPRRLEVGPGLRPRLPIAGTHFLDASAPALARLQAHGGLARPGDITALPYADASFDLVAACDVIEHVENDRRVFGELTRVLVPGGRLIFSVPLHSARWTVFDDYVGHARRYEPAALAELIAGHHLVVEQSVAYGMQSNNPRLLRLAVDGLIKHPIAASRCYNWFFFPLGLLLQQPLKFTSGLMDLSGVDEVLLVCTKGKPNVQRSTSNAQRSDSERTTER
jgi:SAM-dependent methyltransferase